MNKNRLYILLALTIASILFGVLIAEIVPLLLSNVFSKLVKGSVEPIGFPWAIKLLLICSIAAKPTIKLVGEIFNLTRLNAGKPPLCPQCASSMKVRTAKSGEHAGKKFWGCSTYPKCRGIVSPR